LRRTRASAIPRPEPPVGPAPSRTRGVDPAIPAAIAAALFVLAVPDGQVITTRFPILPDPVDAFATTPGPVVLDQRITEELVRTLAAAPRGSPAWISTEVDDLAAIGRAEQLRGILERAGWTVHPLERYGGRLRPGYMLLIGDEAAPPYVDVLAQALSSVGLTPMAVAGYRAHFDQMTRVTPEFSGFAFEPGQTFVLVLGRTVR
jgi:hypothetical protein